MENFYRSKIERIRHILDLVASNVITQGEAMEIIENTVAEGEIQHQGQSVIVFFESFKQAADFYQLLADKVLPDFKHEGARNRFEGTPDDRPGYFYKHPLGLAFIAQSDEHSQKVNTFHIKGRTYEDMEKEMDEIFGPSNNDHII